MEGNNMTALTTRAGWSLPAVTSMADAMRMAELLAESSMVPATYKGKPGDILVAVQMGAELGLAPLQALQNIASINGRPSVWGDAALALVQGHPAYVSHREWVEGEGNDRAGYCAITRRGASEHVQRFSIKDAERAGLLKKPGPWQQYTDRMLVLRARGFALRDKFSDALRGIITAEEAQDMPPAEPRDVPNMAEAPLAAVAAPREEPEAREVPFTLRFLDDQLGNFHDPDDIRGYLAQDLVQAAYYRAKARGKADAWSGIVQAHFARVDPSMREEPEEPEPAADGLELPA
jgi:hypothetical protein